MTNDIGIKNETKFILKLMKKNIEKKIFVGVHPREKLSSWKNKFLKSKNLTFLRIKIFITIQIFLKYMVFLQWV